MKEHLESALVRDFPAVFAGRDRERAAARRGACFGPMAFGCDVGDGWEPVIRRMCARLSALAVVPRLSQVKEKWGLLRVYFDCGRVGHVPPWRWPIAVVKAVLFQLRWKVPGRKWGWRWVLRCAFEYGRDTQIRWTARERALAEASADVAQLIVDAAELESEKVCEHCGAPGVLRRGGWIMTLCDACAKGRPAVGGAE